MKTWNISAALAAALIVGSTAAWAAAGSTETKVVDRLSGSATPAVEVSGAPGEMQLPTGPVRQAFPTVDLGNGNTFTRTIYEDGTQVDRRCNSAGVCTDQVDRPRPRPRPEPEFDMDPRLLGMGAGVGLIALGVALNDRSESD